MPPSPLSPQQAEIFKFLCSWLSCGNGGRHRAGGQEGSFYSLSPYTGHEDQGSGMRVMCKGPRTILSGRPPHFLTPARGRWCSQSSWNKGKPLASRFLCPRSFSFSGFSAWSSPSPIHLLDPRHLSTLPPLAKPSDITALSCELGRPPAGQRLHNPWRLLKVSERLTTLSGPGGRESLSHSLSSCLSFFFWSCKDK